MQRPRIKSEHRPHRLSDHRIRIGGTVYGIAAEIVDPKGWIWALLECLDGTRTVDQVVRHLVHRIPALTPQQVLSGIDQFMAAGYLEDAGESAPAELSAQDRERYSRSRAYFQWIDLTPRETSWHAQRSLRRASVVVVGMGGTGGSAALALAMSGVGRLHCVDPDIVELSNLNRQVLYTENDIGRPKVEAAVEKLRTHNSTVHLTADRRELFSEKELADCVRGHDLLVLCADRPPEIRTWANRVSTRSGLRWVHGGYHGPRVTVGIFWPGSGPCYECLQLNEIEQREPSTGEWTGPASSPEIHAANAVTAGMSGTLVAHAVMSLITGAPALPLNSILGVNLVAPDGHFVITGDSPRKDCPTCGEANDVQCGPSSVASADVAAGRR
ncbi:dinucleotide-utilizing protein [Nonomuraea turkmeniaca]|uniref:Dinucleotide-utilizing protein n=1 Tax=Nonomuraea turkmeniaca TaxID=103838 RepID=A0A5S4EZ65_9ACTN|nr:ThiF family adenylyltransferase [Nonomuraea turkmeniaca]TMR08980.1 dinucleotide-utilizing protein [Nonomuraea turkmeniaca]